MAGLSGDRFHDQQQYWASTTYNVNGAVNIDSLETICCFYYTINGEATIDLCKAIEQRYPKAGIIHIICDNARYYRSQAVTELLETSRIELVFLPPYAPNLN